MTPERSGSPPAAAERLLRWSLAPDERAAVLGDVHEEFSAIAETNSARAVRWYWRQTVTSVLPNIARQIGNQWAEARQIVDERDRRARRRRLIGGLCWMAFVALAFGWLALAVPRLAEESLWDGLIFAIPGPLLVLTYWYRPMPVPSRRARMAQTIWLVYFVIGLLHIAPVQTLQFVLWPATLLFWMWPRAMWPFRRALTVRAYSVHSPVVAYRGKSGVALETTVVGLTPWSMSKIIVGRSMPRIPADSPIDDVVPMTATVIRIFTSRDSIRLFAVVNAAPEGLNGTLEIRRASTDRIIATLPATVRRAVPKLSSKQPYGVDGDSELPLLPRAPMTELDVVVSLAGLAPDKYMFSLVASDGDHLAVQDVDLQVWTGATW